LVRADVIPELVYLDGSGRHEFVVFSDSARRAGIPQYIDNRQIYGYLGRDALPAQVVQARELLRDDLERSGNCRMAQTVAL
jgi:hypothetical protein